MTGTFLMMVLVTGTFLTTVLVTVRIIVLGLALAFRSNSLTVSFNSDNFLWSWVFSVWRSCKAFDFLLAFLGGAEDTLVILVGLDSMGLGFSSEMNLRNIALPHSNLMACFSSNLLSTLISWSLSMPITLLSRKVLVGPFFFKYSSI